MSIKIKIKNKIKIENILISKKDLLLQYIKFNQKNLVNEEVEINKTLDPYEAIKKIQQEFDLKWWQCKVFDGCNGFKLICIIPDLEQNDDIFINYMKTLGWEYSSKYPSYNFFANKTFIGLSFDPKFQDADETAKSFNYMYHLTPKYNVKSILVNGLIPSASNNVFSYSKRIFLIPDIKEKEKLFMNLGYDLYISNKDKRNNGEYVLLGIDISNISKNMTFFADPRFEYGYFTFDTIPYRNIFLIGIADFKKSNIFKKIDNVDKFKNEL